MLSVPPATATSTRPLRISSTAEAMVWRPDAQKRFTVAAGTSVGSPAFRDAIRATFMPCSPSGMAHPMRTSPTSAGSMPGARRSASRIAMAARSSGLTVLRLPFLPLPMGVRAPATITASLMLIPQRLPRLQRVRDPLERLLLAAEAQEHLPLEPQEILLAHRELGIDVPPAERVRELLPDVDIVVREVARRMELAKRYGE